MCGGRPEAPPQSSGSRFSDLPLLVLKVSRNNCSQNPRLINITHQYVFSDLVPRILGIQCKSLNLNAREHCPCYGYPPGISFNHAFVKRFLYGLFQSSKTVAFTRGGVLSLISLTLLLYLSENLLQCKAQRGLTVGIKKEPAMWAMNL